MKRHRLLLLIGVWVLLALGLVACGGGSADSDDTVANEADNSGEVAEDSEAEEVSAGDPAEGEELYNQVCVACHGEGGQGIEGLGKPFTTSEFIRTHSDQELLDFIKQGRPISDPENTTGVDMPPKGGNPALTDDEIMDIIAYIRTLQEE